jgi:hypothetical protein
MRETADVRSEPARIPEHPLLSHKLQEVRDLRASDMTYATPAHTT